jgi:hypothetical protein
VQEHPAQVRPAADVGMVGGVVVRSLSSAAVACVVNINRWLGSGQAPLQSAFDFCPWNVNARNAAGHARASRLSLITLHDQPEVHFRDQHYLANWWLQLLHVPI